jgi:hypothetical protein
MQIHHPSTAFCEMLDKWREISHPKASEANYHLYAIRVGIPVPTFWNRIALKEQREGVSEGIMRARKRGLENSDGSNIYRGDVHSLYVGALISLWLFLFAAQPKELFLDGLKKLEQ